LQENNKTKKQAIATTKNMNTALNHGRRFVASIMKGIVEIPKSDGMLLMRGVTNLETGSILDSVVIRNVERRFWSECVNQVMTPDMVRRVCAVGTPGIGKTTSTVFLIRTLFENKQTVVYRFASEPYYWEFTWRTSTGYDVNVYTQDHDIWDIRSLIDPSTFYIVDPGASRENCLPDTLFQARTIIVSSSDDYECWGRSHLTKQIGNVNGRFMMFPMWDLEELLMARPYLQQRTVITDEDVEARFRQVGGIPRYVFADEEDLLFISQNQKYAIASLTAKDVERIVGGNIGPGGSFDHGRLVSEIICYARTYMDGEIKFDTRKVEFISRSMAEKVSKKFMPDLWRLMLREDEKVGWNKLFEAYCLHLISTPAARSLRCRPCCRKRTYNESQHETDVVLGGCTKVRLGCNIAKKVIEGDSMTLFHSTNPSQDLVDFIYKDNDGTVHAFKATLGKKHTVQLHLIQKLRKSLGNCCLAMYFLIAENRFNEFVTEPTNPKTDELSSVWHVLIPSPNKGQKSIVHESFR
jgi:hypothetical protein